MKVRCYHRNPDLRLTAEPRTLDELVATLLSAKEL